MEGMIDLPPIPVGAAGTLPMEYERACRLVAACTSLDEAKRWANKAEALTAWAKIYGQDQISVEARRLKLHAYRRMGKLADELCPGWRHRGRGPSPLKRLRDAGLKENQALTARAIGLMPDGRFRSAVDSDKPPTPATLAHIDLAPSPKWARVKRAMSVLRTIIDHHHAMSLASEVPESNLDNARILAVALEGWCRQFGRALDKRTQRAA